MKIKKIIIASITASLFLTGCNSTSSESSEDASSDIITINDLIGREVTIDRSSIHKVVCIGAGALRLYTYIGDLDMLSGVEKVEQGFLISIRPYQMVNEELFQNLPLCGYGGPTGSPDAESILECDPDIVFSLYTSDVSTMDTLQTNIGVPVVTLSYGNEEAFDEDIETSISLLGQILNKEDRSNELVNYIEEMKTDLNNRTKDILEEDKPSVYLGCQTNYGTHGFESSTADYSLFNASNIKNVLDVNGYEGYQSSIDLESIVEMNPDKIILDAGGLEIFKAEYSDGTKAEVYNSLSAIKSGEVYLQMPYNAYYTNLETAYCDAYYDAMVSFPESFSDVAIEDKANEITKEFLGVEYYPEIADAMYGGYQKLDIPTLWAPSN